MDSQCLAELYSSIGYVMQAIAGFLLQTSPEKCPDAARRLFG
jgi:hypothetical protein